MTPFHRKTMAALYIALLAMCLCAPLAGCGKYEKSGRDQLEKLAATPVEDVQKAIAESQWQKSVEKFRQAAADGFVSDDEADAAFGGVCFIGDSVTEAINGYGYLAGDKVVATVGVSLQSSGDMISRAAQLYPSHVVLAFGENDLTLDGGDAGVYIDCLNTAVEQVRDEIPGAKIYVASVLPPTAAAIKKEPVLENWSGFNAAIEDYASKTKGVTYINTAGTAESHTDLYEPDGIHLTGEFYGYYLATVGGAIFK